MTGEKLPSRWAGPWALAARQHGVVSRGQLLGLGLSPKAIEHRVKRGRLHPLWRGVYAVGRPEIDQLGWWMAAVLACGPRALLGHRSAAELWGMLDRRGGAVHVVVPAGVVRRRARIEVHRCAWLEPTDRAERHRIPVTAAGATLNALAASSEPKLEQAILAADRLDLIDPESLRGEVDRHPGRPGNPSIRLLLDRHTYTRTDSVLERWFLTIVDEAGLPRPLTQIELNGFRVDFYWPQFGLVVETDGLRYHRTAAQQTRDLSREQAHAAAGLRYLRFAASQIRYERAKVKQILVQTIRSAEREGFPPS